MSKSCFTVNIGNYREFLQQVQQDPEKAKFAFSARTSWGGGTVTRTVARDRVITADEPEALGGTDTAADPVELLLAAVTSCVSIGLVTQAAKRGIDFEDFEIDIEGILDLRGYLGLEDDVRPGYTHIDYTVRIKSDASREVLEEILDIAERTSPMLDNVRHATPIKGRLELINPSTEALQLA